MIEYPAMRGRFAPSPTGAMHLGNARTALLAWLHTRMHGGRHVLRFEDLDHTRVRSGAADLIRRDLQWLGLDWDEEYTQSERVPFYEAAIAQLQTYYCRCSRKEILESVRLSAGAPHGSEVVYGGRCRELALTGQGALRWRIPEEIVMAQDALSGEKLVQDLRADIGDIVLQRRDGVVAYHLAVVVDDAQMGITDVVRGQDLWEATPRQVALWRALEQALDFGVTPRYWHVPLMANYLGERLAKRSGAPSVSQLRESGSCPRVLLGQLLASLVGIAGLQALGLEEGAAISAEELLALVNMRGERFPLAGLMKI